MHSIYPKRSKTVLMKDVLYEVQYPKEALSNTKEYCTYKIICI